MSELEQQIQNRRAKRAALEAAGIEPFPHKFDYDLEPSEVQAQHGDATAEQLEEAALRLRVPGRLRALRKHGKTAFADLRDGTGKIQLMIRTKKLEGDSVTVFENLDLGDFVGAEGSLMRTRTGELTLMVDSLVLLAKALRPLPEKWHGLTDVEARYRQRYLDLIVNAESRKAFEQRARMIRSIRDFMDERGFLEIETPMMQAMAGGATARPFATHHNALDLPLYLRVAPELYHKRLIVGGIHKVYEINRNFRNEGISTQHNPEFTALEFYWAYADFLDVMQLTEDMIVQAARDVLGETRVSFRGVDIDLTPPWPQMRMDEALVKIAGVDPERIETAEGLTAELNERGIPLPKATSYGNLMMHLFEETVEDELQQPIFITHHPIEVSPLTKISRLDPRFTERFELYIAGMEMANAFSELNDPDEQARRFEQQLTAREQGDDEAHQFDGDYVRALEHGMPPTGGQGMGIDRLAMLLTGKDSIRDVIFFPLMRPRAAAEAGGGSSEEE